jgi:hypothetical protein
MFVDAGRLSCSRARHGEFGTIMRGALLVAGIAGLTTWSAFADSPRSRRFIYNSDGGNIFIDKAPPMAPEDVYQYVDEVADSHVTRHARRDAQR